jgi:uncharacterized membrane protein YccC
LLQPEWSWVRQAIQTTVAAVLSYLVALTLQLPQAFWAVMTAIIVVQASVGAALGQALDRLIGTILGAAVGAVLVTTMSANRTMLLALAVFGLSYVAAARPSLRLATVTAAIVIMSDQMLGSPIAAAVDRVAEISLGAAIAVAVTLLLFPARAGSALAEQVSKTMPLFADHLQSTIDAALGKPLPVDDFRKRNATIRAAVRAGDLLAEASRAELAGRLSRHADPAAVLQAVRRLWHSLLSAARASRVALPANLVEPLAPALSQFAAAAQSVMTDLDARYRGSTVTPDFTRLEMAQGDLDAAVSALRATGIFRSVPTDQAARLFTLLFALGQTAENLHDVADRYSDLSATGVAPAMAQSPPGP